MKPHAAIPETKIEVVIAGKPRAGKVLAEAVYDPESQKPRTDSEALS